MPDAALAVTREGTRMLVRFTRPQIDYGMLEALREAVVSATSDPEVRAIVIDVCADGDANDDMGAWPERLAHRQPAGSHGPGPLVEQDAIRAVREVMKPTIAVMRDTVNGLAIDIAAACDVRVANTSMTMADTRIHQGRAASTGITYLLPKLIGQSQATRVLLLGETLSASEAQRIHFVHEVVADADFDEHIAQLGQRIARMPTRAWEVHKMQVIPQLDLPFEAAMTHSLGVRQTHVIEDRDEGMLAWREKRDPEFTGR